MYKLRYYIFPFFLSVMLVACSENDEPEPDGGKQNEPPLEEVGSGEKNGYAVVWEDLFNNDKLDMTKWEIEENGDGGGNSELQYYRKENISLGKEPSTGRGCLIITARKENYLGKNVTSGRLKTSGKYEFTYGKVEASIKLPKTANGLWPAFWLLGADYRQNSWPACGEIDILEMGNVKGIQTNTQDRYFNGACHWGYYQNGGYPNYAVASNAPYSLQDDFHLFTLIWTPEKVSMYLDLDKYPEVKPYYEMNINDTSSQSSPGHYFNKDFFIIFNLAVGGNFPQIGDINRITALADGDAKMYVDYVKVYKK